MGIAPLPRGPAPARERKAAPVRGSSTPVETFFAPARGANTTVEIFFAHAHPKWLIFNHFHRAGAIFLSQRHPERPPGATQGRSFFQAAPSGPPRKPAAWRPPQGLRGLAAVPVGDGRARAGNTPSPDRLEAAAGPAGPGRASSRRAEQSSQRGRRAGGQATRRPEIWRGIATPEIWRAAAHGQTKQPGPTAGPSGARNTSGTTSTSNTTRPRVCGNPSPRMRKTPPRRCGTGFSLPSRV